jgi:hypothetical protein
MAQRKVIDCDKCKAKEVKDPVHVSAPVDRKADGAGSMETEFEDVDLCGKCAGTVISAFLTGGTFEKSRKFFADINNNAIR